MLVYVILMRMVEMTIVQVISVATVPHGGMAATRPMLMGMVRMAWGRTGRHRLISFLCPGPARTRVRLSDAWSISLRTNRSTCSSARA
jgi:hypothetical protein